MCNEMHLVSGEARSQWVEKVRVCWCMCVSACVCGECVCVCACVRMYVHVCSLCILCKRSSPSPQVERDFADLLAPHFSSDSHVARALQYALKLDHIMDFLRSQFSVLHA